MKSLVVKNVLKFSTERFRQALGIRLGSFAVGDSHLMSSKCNCTVVTVLRNLRITPRLHCFTVLLEFVHHPGFGACPNWIWSYHVCLGTTRTDAVENCLFDV